MGINFSKTIIGVQYNWCRLYSKERLKKKDLKKKNISSSKCQRGKAKGEQQE